MSPKLKILLLSSTPGAASTKRIAEVAEKRGHEVRVINPDDCYLYLSESRGNDRLYLKSSEERFYAKDFDRVISRIGGSMYGRHVLNHLNLNMRKFSTSRVSGIQICADKFTTSQVLSGRRLPVISQILTREANEQNMGYLLKLVGGIPFVFKVLSGSQGVGVGIIDSELSAGTTIESISNFAKNVLLQRFIDTTDSSKRTSDIRAFIVNGEVVVSMKRYSKARQFRSNFTISSMGEKVELTNEQKELALDAAAACKSLGICGVDLMQDKDGNSFIIEVNSNPGLKIEDVTGVNVVDKIIDFTELGRLSETAVSRSQKFDVSAQIMGFNYYATGKTVSTTRKNGKPGVLYEVKKMGVEGDSLHYDPLFKIFFSASGENSYTKVDI